MELDANAKICKKALFLPSFVIDLQNLKIVMAFPIDRSLLQGSLQVPSHTLLNTWNQQVIEPKLPFFCLLCKHMTQCLKKKPGSPTEQVSADATHVQDNAPKFCTMEQDVNKPFTLALSVPCDVEMSAVFSPVTIEANIFPVNLDYETMHTTIFDEIASMTCTAMAPISRLPLSFKMQFISLLKTVANKMLLVWSFSVS